MTGFNRPSAIENRSVLDLLMPRNWPRAVAHRGQEWPDFGVTHKRVSDLADFEGPWVEKSGVENEDGIIVIDKPSADRLIAPIVYTVPLQLLP